MSWSSAVHRDAGRAYKRHLLTALLPFSKLNATYSCYKKRKDEINEETTMRLAALSAVLTASLLSILLPPGDLAAAPGDLLETSRTNVNVRVSPTTSAAVVATIDAGERIIEVGKVGEWFQVNLPDRSTQGWIYAPLLERFSAAPATVGRTSEPQAKGQNVASRRTTERHTTAAAYDASLNGNPARGETVFFKCGACHTTVPDVHAEGPSLVGIFGRPPASAPDYRYSGALRAFAREGVVWDEATLDRFIQRPGRVVKGTSMPFSGLRDPQDRRDVIAYLQELSR
jgi:cytochrome c